MSRTRLNDRWRFSLAADVRDQSAAWTLDEGALLNFDPASPVSSGINWLKAGRSYGPAARDFDDRGWRNVELPHDWSVEATPRADAHPRNGFLPAGAGWYRRRITLAGDDVGDDRRVALHFDGVFRDCSVFFNGHLVAQNRSGYIGFTADVSAVAEPGENVLAVHVNASEKEGWFYEGAGIYRHVWLELGDRLHLPRDGVRVESEIREPAGAPSATLHLTAEVQNDRPVAVAASARFAVIDPEGQTLAQIDAGTIEVEPAGIGHFAATAELGDARLWTLEKTDRYTVVAELHAGGATVGRVEKQVGLRTIRFDADRGFFLNEQPLKLKGVCCHQDHAGVGCAIPDALQRWRLLRLKEMGVNAYRASHNPPTPELLDFCDELGILVMDEIRTFGVSEEAQSQLVRLIRRDRHHPSVILWSLANEEMAVHVTDVGRRMFDQLKAVARQHDAGRPFTAGVNNAWDEDAGFARAEDVHGINYLPNGSLDKLRAARPDLPLIVAEASSAISTRGIYANDPPSGHVSEYDDHSDPQHEHIVNWPFWGQAAEPSWKTVAANDYLAGTFVWTGFDYRGEQSPYVRWPSVGSHFGIMDLCGFAKDRFHYYQAWWSGRDVLHLLPHWTWPGREGEPTDVWAYTNAAAVELRLNGRSIGTRDVEPNGHAEWTVAYEPGVLEAIATTHDGRTLHARTQTAGAADRLLLTADREYYDATGDDVAVVTIAVVDAEGVRVPHARVDTVSTIEGAAVILGVGNGDPNSHEPDRTQRGQAARRTFQGLAQVLVRCGGEPGHPQLRVTSPGLRDAALTFPIVST